MLTLEEPNPACTDTELETLRRRVTPLNWPEDHTAFLVANDGESGSRERVSSSPRSF